MAMAKKGVKMTPRDAQKASPKIAPEVVSESPPEVEQPDVKPNMVLIEAPVDDVMTGGYVDQLPRYISGTGLSRNKLAQEGLRRLYRGLRERAKLSTGSVVKSNSQAVQWVLERIAEADYQ
jgi:hypothetical protein